MSEPATGLRFDRASVRVRKMAPGAEDALHTGYHIWKPLDFYYSAFRDTYLAGEVKGVMTGVTAAYRTVFEAFNIVPTPLAERAAKREEHRRRLLDEVRIQYRQAVSRAARAPDASGRTKRRVIEAIGLRPEPSEVDRHFADHPEAIAAAAEIAQLYREIEAAP